MPMPSWAKFALLCAVSTGFVVRPSLAQAQESMPPLGEKEAAIEAALNEPASFDFADKPLAEVVAFLEQKHRIQIQLITTVLDMADTKITCRVHDVKLSSALDLLLLRDLELTYAVHDEMLLITTKSKAENMLTTRVYPVADLLAPRDDGVLVTFRSNFGELIELITSTIRPDSWDETGGPGTIKEHGKSPSLVVSQSYAVHREIATLLASLRTVGQAQAGRGANEPPRAAIEDGQLQLKVYRLPPISVVAGLPQPAVPTQQATSPATQSPKPTTPPAGAPTAPAAANPLASAESMAAFAALQHELFLRGHRELLKMIESVTGPNTWTSSGGQGEIWIVNGSLIVRQTGDVHRQIGPLLDAIREAGPQQTVGMGGMGVF